MSNATLTIEGFVTRDPELRHTQNGDAVLSVSVAHTRRRKNPTTDQFEDVGETLWAEAALWREQAEAYQALIRKGTRVIITGTPEPRIWQSGDKSGVTITLHRATVGLIPKSGQPAAPQQSRSAAPVESFAEPQEGWYEPQSIGGDEVPF